MKLPYPLCLVNAIPDYTPEVVEEFNIQDAVHKNDPGERAEQREPTSDEIHFSSPSSIFTE